MELELNIDFKKHFSAENFFFGVANAPYLCEGGYNTPEGIKNSYGVLEASGKIERSGEAVRFWTNYEEHIKLASSLGLNAFRLGIDWARIQPTTRLEPHDPPPWDEKAVKGYANMIATVIKHTMQPIVTLHHFTHPAWLPSDMWLSDEGPDLLAAYQLKVVEKVNEEISLQTGQVMRHFLVYNEPNIVPLIYHFSGLFSSEKQGPSFMLQVYDNMFSRYVKVYDGLYDLFERKGWGIPHIGFTLSSMCAYELDKALFDIVRLRSSGVERKDAAVKLQEFRAAFTARIDSLAKSKLTDEQYARYRNLVEISKQTLNPALWTKTLDALYTSPRVKKLDYLSINVYEPFSGPKGSENMTNPPLWWEFAADAEVFRAFVHADNEFNTDLPFYLGENSLAYRQVVGQQAEPRPDGWNRERYLKTYLMQMVRCIREGVPIRGYLYWSLVDDFEWEAGFSPRLGLYNYDYIHHHINPTDGLGDPAGEIYAHLIAALRSGDKQSIQRAFTNSFKANKAIAGRTL